MIRIERLLATVMLIAMLSGVGCANSRHGTDAPGATTQGLDPSVVARAAKRMSEIESRGDYVYWIENRPEDGGRSVIIRQNADGERRILTPPQFNVQSRLNEYGGGAFTLADDALYFTNFADQRLYRQGLEGGAPLALTAETDGRIGDCVHDGQRRRLICVQEQHNVPDGPEQALAAIALEGGAPVTIHSGADFLSAPRLSPDGRRLAWLSWNLPFMPWEASTLWTADIQSDGNLGAPTRVAGDEGGVAVADPVWVDAARLAFASDRTGRWQPYVLEGDRVRRVADVPGEIAKPAWFLDHPGLAAVQQRYLVFGAFGEEGPRLYRVDLHRNKTDEIATPFMVDHLYDGALRAGEDGNVYAIARTPRALQFPVRIDAEDKYVGRLGAEREGRGVLWRGVEPARQIAAPSRHGGKIYGFLHAPWTGAEDKWTQTPLIVMMHRGPTRMRTAGLDPEIQFFTSRGYAVYDLNYRGTPGYGRAYREALNGAWGVADIEDAEDAVAYLRKGDPSVGKVFIRGKSAGGYSALNAMANSHVFDGGVSYFGIGDLQLLQSKMHKFEYGYLFTLTGADSIDDPLLIERSPLSRADRITKPLLILQGGADPVVPVSQAEEIARALTDNGVPHQVLIFEGEGHGFRKEETIISALKAELELYESVIYDRSRGQ